MSTFSVIIPAFQASGTLPRAIDSVLEQTLAADEIFVCDDGSTDDTPVVLGRYAERISVVRQANLGLSAARNAAAESSTGEWIVLLDADDEWLPKRLERMAEAIVDSPWADIVTTEAIVRRAGAPDVKWRGTDAWPDEVEEQSVAIVGGSFIFGGAAVRRSALERVGWFRTDLPHDSEWEAWVRLILGGSCAALVKDPLAIYHVGEEGALSRDRLGTSSMMLQVLDEEAGRHSSSVNRAIEQSRERVVQRLRIAEGVAAVRAGHRRGCLRAAMAVEIPAWTRAKFAIAAVFPAMANRRL